MFRLHRGSSNFPFHITNSLGLPHTELTLYACHAGKYHSANTVKVYVRYLLVFFSWAEQNEVVRRQQ